MASHLIYWCCLEETEAVTCIQRGCYSLLEMLIVILIVIVIVILIVILVDLSLGTLLT